MTHPTDPPAARIYLQIHTSLAYSSLSNRSLTPASNVRMATEPILSLSTCIIRPYRDTDVESLAKAANSPRIARWMYTTFPHPYTVDDATSWISSATAAFPMLDFAICDPDKSLVIGSVGLKSQGGEDSNTMRMGYWVAEDHWGEGVATEAATSFSIWAFKTFPNLKFLEGEVFEGNVGSCRVLEKAGFMREQRKGTTIKKAGEMIQVSLYVKSRPGH